MDYKALTTAKIKNIECLRKQLAIDFQLASVNRHVLCLDPGPGGSHGLRVNWSHGRRTVNLS